MIYAAATASEILGVLSSDIRSRQMIKVFRPPGENDAASTIVVETTASAGQFEVSKANF
ncbi:hypothetical protein [Sinorhizobium meliloti]|uniref:hypothetical protein n=1 Tax=Rhizobium meliloti TaxID=382 RepID=UPI0012FE0A70|nr:hypothetical protein [Sinorhizobium meliloti]